MCLQQAVIVIALVAATFNCVAGQDEGSVQLAQYPGAPYEDSLGNLWFPTVLEGVIRYDGVEFATFTTEDGLGGNGVRDILEDERGVLWFATTGGLSRYDGAAFTTLTEYRPMKITRGFAEHGNHRDLWDVLIDRHGGMWIATADGVFRFDGTAFTRFPMPAVAPRAESEFAPSMVYCIYEDDDGDLWFGTDGAGVVRFDGHETVVYTMRGDGLCSNNVCEILRDGRGDYWFGTSNGGVSRYDGESFTTHLRSKEFSKHSGWGRYMGIFEDRDGDVWFGCSYAGGGVYRYDGASFEYFSGDKGLGAGGVPSIREDRSGNVWFGTTAGVYHFDGARFINFTRGNPRLPVSDKDAAKSTRGHHPGTVSLEGWPAETFALPPGFAPGLPSGTESLRFAPGWRDPESEDFWSYAFVMWIDEPVPDAGRVDELLEGYYTGLMTVFAGNRGKDISGTPVRVEVVQTAPNHFEAQMHLIDAFATFKPVEIRVLIETCADADDHSVVSVRLSRQPEGHEIWRSLDAATENMQARAILLESLAERAGYAQLDKQAVETLADAARVRWAREFSGFTYQRVERFSAGGVSHWMSIWLHDKTGLEFVLVPGGTFQMGSSADEAGRGEDEIRHWVTLDPFLIARTECTKSAWARVAGEAGLNVDPSYFDGSDQSPVESVSLADVRTWCRAAQLALPTEAQWEYMCRAGTTTPWTMGSDKADLARFANLGSAECPKEWIEHEMGITEPWHDGYGDELADVGSFNSNSLGLFDVHGNVRELCRDDYISYDVQVEKGTGLRPGTSGTRLARGGAFNNVSGFARSAERLKNLAPTHRMVGFRPSLDLPF